jgi:hypothetical protein
VRMEEGSPVTLHLRVESPNWFDVTRVEVYRNAELLAIFDYQGMHQPPDWVPDPELGIDVPNTTITNLDVSWEDHPAQDSWYGIIALGTGLAPASAETRTCSELCSAGALPPSWCEPCQPGLCPPACGEESRCECDPDGRARNLSPVYMATCYPFLGVGTALQGAFGEIDIGGIRIADFITSGPLRPQVGPMFPLAITNPIWVDMDGDADGDNVDFEPPSGTPAHLLMAAAYGVQAFPLSEASIPRRSEWPQLDGHALHHHPQFRYQDSMQQTLELLLRHRGLR